MTVLASGVMASLVTWPQLVGAQRSDVLTDFDDAGSDHRPVVAVLARR